MGEEQSMRTSWNARAELDPFHFIETSWWDGDVEAFFALGEERARLLIDPVLAECDIKPDRAAALELGCGLGRFTRTLGRRFRQVTAVDVSDTMIARAAELHQGSEFSNLLFTTSDGISLPADDASVDFAFSYEVFQHMPSRRVIRANIGEIRRVLKPQGTGLLQFKRSENLLLRSEVGRRCYEALRGAKHALLRSDPLYTDKTFRGLGGLAISTIVSDCTGAGLDVQRWFVDPTNSSHVFVVVHRRP